MFQSFRMLGINYWFIFLDIEITFVSFGITHYHFLPTILSKKASAVLKCLAKCHKIICEFLVNVLENKRAIRSEEC